MDKLSLYRQYIQELLTKRAKLRSPEDPVARETIFDTVSDSFAAAIRADRYQLVNVGWKDSSTRIYRCVLHVDIKDEKIWVPHDGTEDAIAEQLVALGVPQHDIVLAYHPPHVRQ